MPIAGATDGVNELFGALEGARELIPGNLESRNLVVVTDAKSAKPEVAHRALGRRHLPQFRNRYRIAVCKPRRQARHGWLVPGTKP